MKAIKILKEKAFVIPANGNKIYKAEDIDEATSELEALQQHIKELEIQLSDANNYLGGVHTVKGAKQ